MKSLKFECIDYDMAEARKRMEKSANELRVDGARIVSVIYENAMWYLFYEPNVSGPVIKKGAQSKNNKFYPLGDLHE